MADRNSTAWISITPSTGPTKAIESAALSVLFRINHKISRHFSLWSHRGSGWVYVPISIRGWYSLRLVLINSPHAPGARQKIQFHVSKLSGKKSVNININTSDSPQGTFRDHLREELWWHKISHLQAWSPPKGTVKWLNILIHKAY